jgi:hypothetical protein
VSVTSPVTPPDAPLRVTPAVPTCPRCRRPLQAVDVSAVCAMVPSSRYPGALVPGPPVVVRECPVHGLFHGGAK